jgi:hypothetical protein
MGRLPSRGRLVEYHITIQGAEINVMTDMKHLRKRFYVDAKVQGGLVVRVVMYWVLCLLGVFLMLLCWRIIVGERQPFTFHLYDLWVDFAPALTATMLLLPLVIVDIIRFSNRFVGPTMRLRRSLRQLARGQYVEPIEFRGSDFWQEFADEFNTVAAHLQGCGCIDMDKSSNNWNEEHDGLRQGQINDDNHEHREETEEELVGVG